jgi:hypothetical protein
MGDDDRDTGIRFTFEYARPRPSSASRPAKPRDTSFQIGGGISSPPRPVEQLEAPKMLNKSRPEHPENVEQNFVEQSPERLVHIGLRIPSSMLAEIDAVALTTHDSMSEAVRRLLRRALDAEP